MSGYFNKNVPYFNMGGYRFENSGDIWLIYDEDGVPEITGNNQQVAVRTKEEAYALLGI